MHFAEKGYNKAKLFFNPKTTNSVKYRDTRNVLRLNGLVHAQLVHLLGKKLKLYRPTSLFCLRSSLPKGRTLASSTHPSVRFSKAIHVEHSFLNNVAAS